MKIIKNTARSWLIENGYEDIAKIIDEIMEEWKIQGIGTRRNWWEKLCGSKGGKPLKVLGREIPILRAAQIRKGYPITENAICRNENEIVPLINKQ
ncbi:MAG TPA: hypothetical protein DER09_09670 [Prolixibacteraceae bacterium]|nr:hypothetical protein [Prolixibacteraceae bacterium]